MNAKQRQAIADEILATMVLPDAAREKPLFCLCMIGLVGSGKSTVLQSLIKSIPMVRQSGDDIRMVMKSRNMQIKDSLVIASVGAHIARQLKSTGYRVAHDNDFANPAIRTEMQELNSSLGVPEVWIRVIADEVDILKRLQERELGHFSSSQEAISNYYERKQLHENQAKSLGTLPFVYTFNTSGADIDTQIGDAVQKIRNHIQSL